MNENPYSVKYGECEKTYYLCYHGKIIVMVKEGEDANFRQFCILKGIYFPYGNS